MTSITYWGKPCRHGHNGRRYLSNGHCVFCISRTGKKIYREKKARRLECTSPSSQQAPQLAPSPTHCASQLPVNEGGSLSIDLEEKENK
jgi:hypothetical protein